MSEWDSTIIPNNIVDDARLSDKAFRLAVLQRRNQGIGMTCEFVHEKTGWTPQEIAKAILDLESHGWSIEYLEEVK